LTDNDLRRALSGDGDARVMHVFVDEDDSSADHVWILSIQEKDNLSKYRRSGRVCRTGPDTSPR
jgi:hypothetical protein